MTTSLDRVNALMDKLRRECMRAEVGELEVMACKLERLAKWVRDTKTMIEGTDGPDSQG